MDLEVRYSLNASCLHRMQTFARLARSARRLDESSRNLVALLGCCAGKLLGSVWLGMKSRP